MKKDEPLDLTKPICLFDTFKNCIHASAEFLVCRQLQGGRYEICSNGKKFVVGADNRVITPADKEIKNFEWVAFHYGDLEVRNLSD
jgi:hypothetical protein